MTCQVCGFKQAKSRKKAFSKFLNLVQMGQDMESLVCASMTDLEIFVDQPWSTDTLVKIWQLRVSEGPIEGRNDCIEIKRSWKYFSGTENNLM